MFPITKEHAKETHNHFYLSAAGLLTPHHHIYPPYPIILMINPQLRHPQPQRRRFFFHALQRCCDNLLPPSRTMVQPILIHQIQIPLLNHAPE